MAGNENSGRTVTFTLSENKLEEEIAQYKAMVEDGTIPRASWPHFAAFLDYTEAELAEVMALADKADSGYKMRARMLKRMATWVRGQYMSGAGWIGQMTAKAAFALKQDIGDGVKWTDKDDGKTGPVQVVVSFGGSDPRAKKAGK